MEKLPDNRTDENLVSHNNTPKNEKESIIQELRFKQHRGIEPVSERELEKTLEDIRFIELAQKSVLDKIKSFGLEVPKYFDIERIHILPSDYYSARMENNQGQYDVIEDRIKVKQQKDFFRFFQVVTHELIHAYSCNKFYIKETEEGFKGGVYRSGYIQSKKINQEELYSQFHGFTEAIIEDLQREITYETASELAKITGSEEYLIKLKSLNQNSYFYERELLHYVVNKFSDENNTESTEVWQKLRRGLFNGEMMFLREFEEVFGPDTMRVLAAYGARDRKGNEEKYFDSFKKYFNASIEERSVIAKKLIKRG